MKLNRFVETDSSAMTYTPPQDDTLSYNTRKPKLSLSAVSDWAFSMSRQLFGGADLKLADAGNIHRDELGRFAAAEISAAEQKSRDARAASASAVTPEQHRAAFDAHSDASLAWWGVRGKLLMGQRRTKTGQLAKKHSEFNDTAQQMANEAIVKSKQHTDERAAHAGKGPPVPEETIYRDYRGNRLSE